MPFRRTATVAALFTALAVAPHAEAQTSADVKRELERVTTRLQQAETEEAVLADRLTKLERELKRTEQALAAVRGKVSQRARVSYISGFGSNPMEVLLTSPDPNAALDRLELLESATRGDLVAMTKARVLGRQQRAQRQAIDDAVEAKARARKALDRESAQLAKLFEVVARAEAAEAARKAAAAERARQARIARERDERRREAAEARARRAAADRASRQRQQQQRFVSSGSYACPVGPAHSFSDTWGAARSGGRRHQGTDIFAPHGDPVYAVTSGTVRTDYNRLGGVVIYLRGDDGTTYYYAHNSANVARTGQRVAQGELIARVGKTGNAQGTPPHVHFERHPGGGAAVNPYPFLKAACG